MEVAGVPPQRQKHALKWLTRFGLPVALLAVLAFIVVMVLAERSRAALHAWRPLPGGGEFRLLAITHGVRHSVSLDKFPLADRLRAAWKARSLSPLTDHVGARSATYSSGRPSLRFWLEARNLPKSEPPFCDGALVLPDGQIFRVRGRFGSMSGSGGVTVFSESMEFPFIPARAKKLRFDVRINETPFVFKAPNPAYRTDLPVWKADPMPQTKRHGNVAVTLGGVNVFLPQSRDRLAWGLALADWYAQPLWTIKHGEFPGDRSHRISAVFEDPGGNSSSYAALFSERVWKVRATITRTEHFPFSEDEVQWIGTIDPAVAEASTPQGYALLPLAADRPVGRLKLVGVFGPGKFTIKDGVVTAAEPYGERPRTSLEEQLASWENARALDLTTISDSDFRTLAGSSRGDRNIGWDGIRAVRSVRLAQPAVLILEDRFAPPGEFDLRIFRDEGGSPVRLKERPNSVVNRLSLGVYDLPAKPVRCGVAKSAPFQLEFFIPAPARPSSSSSGRSAR